MATLRLVVLLLIGSCLAACTGARPHRRSPHSSPTDPIRVLMIGDSITFGIMSRPLGRAYAGLVADALGPDYEVINVGCGGTGAFSWTPGAGPVVCLGRTEAPVDLFDAFVSTNAPVDIATVLLGTNDAAIHFSTLDYRRNLSDLIDGLLGAGTGAVVLMTPPKHVRGDPTAQLRIAQYARLIVDPQIGLCRTRERVTCGPDLFELLDPELHFAPRNAHPNGPGHARIAEALVGSILAIPEPGSWRSAGWLPAGAGRRAWIDRLSARRSPAPLTRSGHGRDP